MAKKIIIAEHAGFCFGVKRAVDIAVGQESKEGANKYTLGPLIHNNDVINRLKDQNINQIQEEDFPKLSPTDAVVIRSHGVAPGIIEQLRATGAHFIDATCPYVSSIQRKVQKYYALGYSIIIVGDRTHPEVIGINGWCNNSAIITKDGSDLTEFPSKVCIVSQTTEQRSNYINVVELVSAQSEEVQAFNTICKATTDRQNSADEVSKKVDLMIVIGGKTSSNSRKLFEICSRNCKNTLFIENSNELSKTTVQDGRVQLIGITAGASTPDWVIQEVVDKVRNYSDIE
jgi:4-hydroxy-3-methylbut-2-enyl diphosphate reductase